MKRIFIALLTAAGIVLLPFIGPWGTESISERDGRAPRGRTCLGPSIAQAQESNGGGIPEFDYGSIFGDGCVDLELGPCVCGVPPKPCLRVTYWEPRLVIWTKQGPATKAHGPINLQYEEVTAWPFPLGAIVDLIGFPLVCSDEDALTIDSLTSIAASYSSLADVVSWRTGGAELIAAEGLAPGLATVLLPLCATQGLAGVQAPGLADICMGVWGPLFPRTGWLLHSSEPVGSGAGAYRAAHIISHPELLWGRVAVPATDFRASTKDKQNLVVPRTTQCIRPGTIPTTWESFTLSPTGDYVWIYWVKRSCCISPTLFDSGLTY